MLTQRGRFHAAANHQKDVAQIYETDIQDLKEAYEAYNLAAEWYSNEDFFYLLTNKNVFNYFLSL